MASGGWPRAGLAQGWPGPVPSPASPTLPSAHRISMACSYFVVLLRLCWKYTIERRCPDTNMQKVNEYMSAKHYYVKVETEKHR